MEIEAAREVVELLLAESARLNAFLVSCEGRLQPSDFAHAKQIVGALMGTVYIDGLRPLLREHPGLKPDGLNV